MLEKFLNKEEKKLFSKKTLKKIKKEDFFTYLEMEETLLQSLKEKYEKDNYKNPITEEEIKYQEKYVDKLNKYYYDVVLLSDKTIDPIDKIIDDFELDLKKFNKFHKIEK